MVSIPPALKKRRFRFTSSTAGWALVECLNCTWKRRRSMPDAAARVLGLAGKHDCPGVETAEQAEVRHALEVTWPKTRAAFEAAFTRHQEAGRG